MQKPKAVILMSGGLDSMTCLAIAQSQGFDCFCLSVDYGQRHRAELTAAKTITATYGATEHITVNLALDQLVSCALTQHKESVVRTGEAMDSSKSGTVSQDADTKAPPTYVPARNTILLSIALGWAETLGAHAIFCGGNAEDIGGYPDCRPEYFRAYETLMNLATHASVAGTPFKIHTPLQALSKADIIRLGSKLGVDYGLSVTCYNANEQQEACGQCDSCQLRRQGFLEAGITDPTRYQSP